MSSQWQNAFKYFDINIPRATCSILECHSSTLSCLDLLIYQHSKSIFQISQLLLTTRKTITELAEYLCKILRWMDGWVAAMPGVGPALVKRWDIPGHTYRGIAPHLHLNNKQDGNLTQSWSITNVAQFLEFLPQPSQRDSASLRLVQSQTVKLGCIQILGCVLCYQDI